MNANQQLGQEGEQLAARFLSQKNYELLATNVETPYGELDLIMKDVDDTLVFVEVKTRSSYIKGWPEEAITKTKLQHLNDSISHYCQNCNHTEDWRLDIIAVMLQDDQMHVRHYKNWEV